MTQFKGELKGIPNYIVEQMLQEQEKQGNKRDVSVFEKNIRTDQYDGGFNWNESSQGRDYWLFIIEQEGYKYLPQSSFPTLLTYEPLEEKINKLQEQLDELKQELRKQADGHKEPVAGELAIFWDIIKSRAIIRDFKDKNNGYFIDGKGIRWNNAILFESKDQFEKFINS